LSFCYDSYEQKNSVSWRRGKS